VNRHPGRGRYYQLFILPCLRPSAKGNILSGSGLPTPLSLRTDLPVLPYQKKNRFFLQIQKTIFKGIRKAKEKYIHSSLTKQKEKKAK